MSQWVNDEANGYDAEINALGICLGVCMYVYIYRRMFM